MSEHIQCLSLSDLFYLASYPQGPFILSQMMGYPFSWLNNIPLCVCFIFSWIDGHLGCFCVWAVVNDAA